MPVGWQASVQQVESYTFLLSWFSLTFSTLFLPPFLFSGSVGCSKPAYCLWAHRVGVGWNLFCCGVFTIISSGSSPHRSNKMWKIPSCLRETTWTCCSCNYATNQKVLSLTGWGKCSFAHQFWADVSDDTDVNVVKQPEWRWSKQQQLFWKCMKQKAA